MKIHLIDEICGSGKTTYMMDKINEWNDNGNYEQFVYISPLLEEVGSGNSPGRIQKHCPNVDFKSPVRRNGSKLEDVKHLIRNGENISSTHALLRLMGDGCVDILKEQRNVLIIDEAVSAIEVFNDVSPQGVATLVKGGQLIRCIDTGKLSWNHADFPLENCKGDNKAFEYRELVELCDSGYAYAPNPIRDDTKNAVVIWQFPKELLECFTDVYVLTYLFEGSVMKVWADINGFDIVRVRPKLPRSTESIKESLKYRIKLYDGHTMKRLGKYRLTQTFWQTASQEEVNDIKTSLANTLKNSLSKEGIRVEDMLVSCPKHKWYDKKLNIRGKGYARAEWIASSHKATNKFKDKSCLIYALNKYPNSYVYNFCKSKGYHLDPDEYCLTETVQTIFRTCIRQDNNDILHLLLLSTRMRKIIEEWIYQ